MSKRIIITLLIIASGIVIAQHKTNVNIRNNIGAELSQQIPRVAAALLSAVNEAFYQKKALSISASGISNYGQKTIHSLYDNAPFYCPETELSLYALRMPNGQYELRGIPLILRGDDDTAHHEEAVLLFNARGQLEDLYFGIQSQRYHSLIQSGKNVTDLRCRQIILDFIENYRTAYNRKDLPYIEEVFSDNALIIVGRVLEEKKGEPDFLERNFKDRVKFFKLSKREYIQSLRKSFDRNSYIKVDFDKIEIVQHRKLEHLYGVMMVQTWKAQRYGDKGYLFLLVDFRDEVNPLIHVRAWQPDKFTKPGEALSLGDFEIIE